MKNNSGNSSINDIMNGFHSRQNSLRTKTSSDGFLLVAASFDNRQEQITQ